MREILEEKVIVILKCIMSVHRLDRLKLHRQLQLHLLVLTDAILF